MPKPSRLILPLFATAAFIATAAIAGSAAGGSRTYTTSLTGAAEVPGPGDADGSGTATVTVNAATKEVCYELEVAGIAPAFAAHIHSGSATVAGPVVVTLDAPATGSSDGCVDITARLAAQILARPQLYYVNVHNAEYPAGALRGQL